MEGRAHRQEHALLGAEAGGDLHGPLDGALVPRNDDLPRRVHVGHAHHLALRSFRAGLLGRGQLEAEERRHGARAHGDGLLHELAAPADEPHGIDETDGSRHHEGRVLAQAVTGGQVGLNAALLEGGGRGHAGREDGRLGIGRELEGVRRPLEAEAGEGKAQGLVGLLPHHGGGGRGLREGPPHAHGLRALPGTALP